MCGEVVNESIRIVKCTLEKHAKERRDRNAFCIDCGTRLITATATR